MTISSINLTRLNVAELLQFSSDLATTVKNYDPVALDVEVPYNDFIVLVDSVSVLFEPTKSNPQTEELIILDERRDNAIIGIALYLESMTYHFDTNTKQYAKILLNYIQSYGGSIARKNYPTETAIISNIVTDFNSKPELMNLIPLLGLELWKNELANANAAFNLKYLERAKTASSESDETVSSKRKDLVSTWNSLAETIEAHYKLKSIKKAGFEPYETLIKNLNAIIDKYNLILANRTKKGTNGAKTTDTASNSSKTID